ncbi:MAG: hypothetical protein MK183_13675, partial [Verrucomicrobiales bacterium]|nr:hypothetical protein [Verrucomicrobiales bacterium]
MQELEGGPGFRNISVDQFNDQSPAEVEVSGHLDAVILAGAADLEVQGGQRPVAEVAAEGHGSRAEPGAHVTLDENGPGTGDAVATELAEEDRGASEGAGGTDGDDPAIGDVLVEDHGGPAGDGDESPGEVGDLAEDIVEPAAEGKGTAVLYPAGKAQERVVRDYCAGTRHVDQFACEFELGGGEGSAEGLDAAGIGESSALHHEAVAVFGPQPGSGGQVERAVSHPGQAGSTKNPAGFDAGTEGQLENCIAGEQDGGGTGSSAKDQRAGGGEVPPRDPDHRGRGNHGLHGGVRDLPGGPVAVLRPGSACADPAALQPAGIKLVDVTSVLGGAVNHSGSVRADLEIPFHIAACDEGAVELGDASATDRNTVKLCELIGVLNGAVNHGESVRADLEPPPHIAACGEGAVELGGNSTPNEHTVKLEDIIGVLVGAVNHSGSVRTDLETCSHHIAACDEGAVELDDDSTPDRHTVKLVDAIGVLVGAVNHGGAVRAELVVEIHITAIDEGPIKFGDRPAADGHAVKLDDLIGVLIGAVNHGGSVRADSELSHLAICGEGAVELGGNSTPNEHTVKLEDIIGVLVGAVNHSGSVR